MDDVRESLEAVAPDDGFTKKVAEAIEVYLTPGPSKGSTLSPWADSVRATVDGLAADPEGAAVASELLKSPHAKVREKAALQLGLSRTPEGRSLLAGTLEDESVRVRMMAVRAYAASIHPEMRPGDGLWDISLEASSEPDGLERLVSMLRDDHVKVRWYAVLALGAYVAAGSRDAREGLEVALRDPAHRVRHEAARRLEIPCPDCT
jgi:HEAT repeat protein